MKSQTHFINKISYIVLSFWTFIVIIMASISVLNSYYYDYSLAENEAETSVKKDLAYRSWVASHGGLYVPITAKTSPDPYLSHIKNRDVRTTDGQRLTLLGPAYSLSQIMHDYGKLYGVKGHITSRIFSNPQNKPDAWEEKVLQKVEISREAFSQIETMDDKEYLRYLRPLIIQKSCLKCHAFQGYKIGDIHGAVSVAIPIQEYRDKAFKNSIINVATYLFIYIIGLIVLFYSQKRLKFLFKEKIKDYEQHIFSLVDIIEKRDSYTAGHTQRVATYSMLIATKMGFNEEKINILRRACMLHDIGKISTPDSILLKPGKLTELEYEIIKEHVVVGYELLNKVDIYKEIAEIIRHHHEQYDGSGYPQGIKGDAIPVMSQIMIIADAFDAMTTNRIYKAKKTVSTALQEFKELSGQQFNPQIVSVAIEALKNVKVDLSITQKPTTKIERERFSYFYRDKLSNLYNEDYLEFVLMYQENEFDIKCLNIIYLQNFTQYNHTHSWKEGDKLLQRLSGELTKFSNNDLIFRVYGDDFIILNKEHYDISNEIKGMEKILEHSGVTLSSIHYNLEEENIHSLEELEKILR